LSNEQPGYISTERGRLFRVMHRPAAEPAAAVLLVPPCGDEKRAAYGACARLARALSSAGAAVLRFDCFGTGDSAGESAEVTLSSMREDARAAAGEIQRLVPGAPLMLLGVRLGASLALEICSGVGARKVAAIAPLLSGASWLRQERGRKRLRRSMVRREMTAAGADPQAVGEEPLPDGVADDLDGLPVSEIFAAELEAFDMGSSPLPGDRARSLLVQVSPRRTPLPEIADIAGRCGAEVLCLHLEPFWQPLEPGDLAALITPLEKFLLGDRQ